MKKQSTDIIGSQPRRKWQINLCSQAVFYKLGKNTGTEKGADFISDHAQDFRVITVLWGRGKVQERGGLY